MSHTIGTDSEIGPLRCVLVHRPGEELRRVTPRTRGRLAFGGIPWVARAQQEHDALTDVLRARGADVLYVTGLLQDVLEYQEARDEAIAGTLGGAPLGDELGRLVRGHLESLAPEDLAGVLVAGLARGELRAGRGLVHDLLGPHEFILDPLPHLMFSRDSSVPIGDQVVVAGLAGPRRREAALLATVYRHHPRFARLTRLHLAGRRRLDAGDVVLLAPGAIAVGVGGRTSPEAAEWLARELLGARAAEIVLAVPMGRAADGDPAARGPLGAACAVIGADAVVMTPSLAFTLTALTITLRGCELAVSHPRPFLEAAARAMGVSRLTVIGTGLDPLALPGHRCAARPGAQWDDGGGALVVGERAVVCDERSCETNARLAAAGYEVLTVASGELGGSWAADRGGGPRALCAALRRDPVPVPGQPLPGPAREAIRRQLGPVPPAGPEAQAARAPGAGPAPVAAQAGQDARELAGAGWSLRVPR